MTAMASWQRFLFCVLLILGAGAPRAEAQLYGDPCSYLPQPPSPWTYGAGTLYFDDECNFSVDFGAGEQIGWLFRPTVPDPGPVEVYNFRIGPEFPDLLPGVEFRLFDLISVKTGAFRLSLRQEVEGFELLGAVQNGVWQPLTPAAVAIESDKALDISLVIVRSPTDPAVDLAVYVDGVEVMAAADVLFSHEPTTVRLGVVVGPGPAALGTFSFRPLP